MDDGDRRAGVASYDDPADGKQRGRVKEVEEEAPKEEKKAAPKKAAAKKKAPAKRRTAAKKK
jgi:hypothetical protein